MMNFGRTGSLGPRGEYPYLYANPPYFLFFCEFHTEKGDVPKGTPLHESKRTPLVHQNVLPT